jgi:hypothetical protein
MNEVKKNQLDDWLKWLGRLAIIGTVIAFCLIAVYTYFTRGTISNQQSDWASFGSFLSGVFSFLGAIGTVGVMLLGIKQFKVQQDQINAQTDRQNSFEEKQEEKWAKENEMLNFKKYQMHVNHFEKLFENIEKDYNVAFNDKSDLYFEQFPNNNFTNTSFEIIKDSLSEHLIQHLEAFQRQVEAYTKTPSATNFLSLISGISGLKGTLRINEFKSNDKLDIKVFGLYEKDFVKVLGVSLTVESKLRSFCNLPPTDFIKLVTYMDVFFYDLKNFTSVHTKDNIVKDTFLEFLVLLQASIKHDPTKYIDLYNLSEYKFTANELNSIHTQFETYRTLIIESGLNPAEQNILAQSLKNLTQEHLLKNLY